MSAVDLIAFGASGGGSAALWYVAGKIGTHRHLKRNKAAIEADKTDGRTSKEWYEILKGMGREEYEKLSRGALDGLEEHHTYGRWDVKTLLKGRYDDLMMEWYPEKYCKYCRKQGCKQQCDAYWAGMPPCKICRKSLKDDTCDYCGYENFKWEPHPRKPEPKRDYVDELIKKPTAMITTGSGDNFVYITDSGMALFTKHKIQVSDFKVRGIDEPGYRISRNGKSWIVGRQEIKNFQKVKGLPVNGIMNTETKKAIVNYLDAGNSWPVKPQRLTVSQAEQVQRELDKWKHTERETWELNW